MIYGNSLTPISPSTTDEQTLLEEGFFKEIERWSAANQDSDIKKYSNSMLTEDEYKKVKSYLDVMTTTEDYNVYKKAFNRFCYFCHIVPRGVILTKYKLKKSLVKDHNSLNVEYRYNTKKMELPEGAVLYHLTTVDNLTELKPFFRGKSAKGYLYDKPRIYFTIRKSMPKGLADYGSKDKMNMYVCKQKIKSAFVDPLLWGYISGAIYIETNKPVKVEKVKDDNIDELKDKNDKALKESSDEFNFEDFFTFVSENGLILAEE